MFRPDVEGSRERLDHIVRRQRAVAVNEVVEVARDNSVFAASARYVVPVSAISRSIVGPNRSSLNLLGAIPFRLLARIGNGYTCLPYPAPWQVRDEGASPMCRP